MLDLTRLASIPFAAWRGPGWWIVFVPLVWFAVAFLFFFVFRRAGCRWGWWGGYGQPGSARPDPLEVLGRHFAEGEISDEEYHSRRSTLEKSNPGVGSNRWASRS